MYAGLPPAAECLLESRRAGFLSQLAEERLEAVVAERRADASVNAAPRHAAIPAGEDELEALVAARRKARQEKAGGFCPKCGKPVTKTDQFCSRCGAVLS